MPKPSTPPITALGTAVREHRGKTGQPAAAKEIGIPTATLSRIERGSNDPTLSTAESLARWLGWSLEQVAEAARTPATTTPEPLPIPPPSMPSLVQLSDGYNDDGVAMDIGELKDWSLPGIEAGHEELREDAARIASRLSVALALGRVPPYFRDEAEALVIRTRKLGIAVT